MKKVLAVLLCVSMVLSAFGFTVTADGVREELYEEEHRLASAVELLQGDSAGNGLADRVFVAYADMSENGNADAYVRSDNWFSGEQTQVGYTDLNLANFSFTSGNNIYTAIVDGDLTISENIKTEGDLSYYEVMSAENEVAAVKDAETGDSSLKTGTYYYNAGTADKVYFGNKYNAKLVVANTEGGGKPGNTIETGGDEAKQAFSVCNFYTYAHNGRKGYLNPSSLLKAKKGIDIGGILRYISADFLVSKLEDVSRVSGDDLLTGETETDEVGYGGYFVTQKGTKYKVGPVADSGKSVNNVLRFGDNASVNFETPSEAEYLDILINTGNADGGAAGTVKAVVNYLDGEGNAQKKEFVLLSSIASYKNAEEYYSNVIVKVPEETTFDFDSINGAKTNSKGLSAEKISFENMDTNFVLADEVEEFSYYGTENGWYPTLTIMTAGSYRIPVGDLGEITSVSFTRGNSVNGIAASDSWNYVHNNQRNTFIPVTVENGEEGYKYYAFTGTSWEGRSLVYGLSLEGKSLEQILEMFNTAVDKLSDTFKEEEFDTVNAAKNAYDTAKAAGIEDSFFDSARVEKLNRLLEEAKRYTEITKQNKYDYADIDFNIADGKYAATAFENSSVVSIKNDTEYFEKIKGQKYLSTSDAKNIPTVEELSNTNVDTTRIKGIGFWASDLVNAKYRTFPNGNGDYIIRSDKGTEYKIKNVSENAGESGVNAGYITADIDTDNIYTAGFDSKTLYNSINILAAGISEPVWMGTQRRAGAAQAKVTYADGTTKTQLIVIPSQAGFAAGLAGKLKSQEQVTGINLGSGCIYKNISYSYVEAMFRADYKWIPKETMADDVFSLGGYMTNAFVNNRNNRYEIENVTVSRGEGAGSVASIKIDTEGKAVEKVEIMPATTETLEKAGAFLASANGDTYNYYIPVEQSRVTELIDKTGKPGTGILGAVDGDSSYSAADVDFYISVQVNMGSGSRGMMAVLMGVSGEKKYASIKDAVDETEELMNTVTEDSDAEVFENIEKTYDTAISLGAKDSDFDADIMSRYREIRSKAAEKAEIRGELTIVFDDAEGEAKVTADISNSFAKEGKTFAILAQILDKNGKTIKTVHKDYVSVADKKQTEVLNLGVLDGSANQIKAMIVKSVEDMKPLGEMKVCGRKTYAVDSIYKDGQWQTDSTGDLNVVFIGDSLTSGDSSYEIDKSDTASEKHWTNVISTYFANMLPNRSVHMYNAGIGGVTSDFLKTYVQDAVVDKNPDVVFIENINDWHNNDQTVKTAVENIVRNLASLEKQPLIILYNAVAPYPYVSSSDYDRQRKLSKRHSEAVVGYNIPVMDYISYWENEEKAYDSREGVEAGSFASIYYNKGNVHPKINGYNLMGTFATAELGTNPEKYFVKHKVLAQPNNDGADTKYIRTFPGSERFTYSGFTIVGENDKGQGAYAIQDLKFKYPFGGVAQSTGGGDTIEFKTSAKETVINYTNPNEKYRCNTVKVYVDGELKTNGGGSNEYANNFGQIKIYTDGGEHTVKIVTDTPVDNGKDTGSKLDIFNFLYLSESF